MPLGKGKKVIDPFSSKEYQKRSKKQQLGRTLSTSSLASIWDGISNFRHTIFFAKEKVGMKNLILIFDLDYEKN